MKILLIDLENCPSALNEILEHLENYSQIVICYAQSEAKIPIGWVIPLTKVINSEQLKIIKMPTIGKNSADFGIAFWAGRLMEQVGEAVHFDIVSNDTDLDYVVELLDTENRSARRFGRKFRAEVEIEEKTIQIPTPISRIPYYCRLMANHPNTQPKTLTGLSNDVKVKFKGTVLTNEFIDELKEKSIINVKTDGKIIFDQKKLNEFKTWDITWDKK